MRYALRILKPLSNNAAEYEALLTGLRIGRNISTKEIYDNFESGDPRLKIYGDSKLVIDQVNGHSQAKDPTMMRYLEKVQRELQEIKKLRIEVQIEHIPREKNEEADEIAKLAADITSVIPIDVMI